MIEIMVNDSVQERNQFRVSLSRQPALEHGQLQPLSKSFHEPKYAFVSTRRAVVWPETPDVALEPHAHA
jgi:hypothetical protein